ncbi:hypothetical protein FRC07_000554, partial [Ceratobasidium sp. 392]
MVGELLQPSNILPGDCDKVGGEGLRNVKEGLETMIGWMVNSVPGVVRTKFGSLADVFESTPEPL